MDRQAGVPDHGLDHRLDERITADALALARRRWGRTYEPEGVLLRAGLDEATAQAMLGWAASHYRGPGGRTALDLYLEERGAGLDLEARGLIGACQAAWLSLHEVVSAESGETMVLRDLLAGGQRTVRERTASRSVRARDVLLARVIDLGDRMVLGGCHLRSLPPRLGEQVRKEIRRALRVRAAKVPVARLQAASADGTLLEIWQAAVDALDSRPLPTLRDTDGEDLLLTGRRS